VADRSRSIPPLHHTLITVERRHNYQSTKHLANARYTNFGRGQLVRRGAAHTLSARRHAQTRCANICSKRSTQRRPPSSQMRTNSHTQYYTRCGNIRARAVAGSKRVRRLTCRPHVTHKHSMNTIGHKHVGRNAFLLANTHNSRIQPYARCGSI
jgi:hypothetical protein